MQDASVSGTPASMTILIIDDEEMIRDLVRDILEMQGYTIISAKDGIEGIELYKANLAAVDCIILDLSMPRLGGKETYIRLRELGGSAKILLSSGRGTDGQTEELIALGIDGLIQKPYRMDELIRIVGDAVRK